MYACGCIFSVVWFIRFSSGVISLCYIHWHNNGYAKDEWITMFWFDFVLFSTPFIRRLFAHICVDFDTRTRTSRARMSIIMDMFWQIGWVRDGGLQYVYRWIFHCREQTKRLKEKALKRYQPTNRQWASGIHIIKSIDYLSFSVLPCLYWRLSAKRNENNNKKSLKVQKNEWWRE